MLRKAKCSGGQFKMIAQEKSIKQDHGTKWKIENKRERSLKKILVSWEMMLIVLLVGIMIMILNQF